MATPKEIWQFCLSCLDLTTLDPLDSPSGVEAFVRRAAEFNRHFPHLPSAATVCVWPRFVDTAGLTLGESEIGITAVGAGFPSSKTFLEVKILECAMAEESGADEIDIVLDPGLLRDGQDGAAASEIALIRGELEPDTVLKVILETGILSPEEIRRASMLALRAGADFIKTSTGKQGPGASPEAFRTMCEAVRDYFRETGRRAGVKAAGGIRTAEEAAVYYGIVEEILGSEWLTPDYFRLGASSLANDLLSKIEGKEIRYY